MKQALQTPGYAGYAAQGPFTSALCQFHDHHQVGALCRPLSAARSVSGDLESRVLEQENAAIIRTQTRLRGTTADARPIDSETDRVFACQGEAIKVDPPPWLNVETGQDGATRIVGTRVPAVSHR